MRQKGGSRITKGMRTYSTPTIVFAYGRGILRYFMKIKYVHSTAPMVEKVYETEKSLKGCAGILHALGNWPTQKEWDEDELRRFERAKTEGTIRSYSIMNLSI